MCCANPKGRAPESACTRTHTHAGGRGPDPQPGSAPHGRPALGMGVLELLPWTAAAGEAGTGEGKIKPDPCAHHPGLCSLMATAEAAREVVIHPLQPWPAQRMALNKKQPSKHPKR